MNDDIVTRLRLWASVTEGDHVIEELHKAADEIERLRGELKRQSLQANIMRNVAMVPYGNSAGVIEELMADRDRWVEIAQLWDGAYSAQTYIHGLDEIETADMARKAQAKAVRGE